DEVVRLAELAGENQAPCFGQQGSGVGIVGLVGTARPECCFIQLHPFAVDAAEEHSAQPPVANGQGLGPAHRGAAIPKRQRFLRWGLRAELNAQAEETERGNKSRFHGVPSGLKNNPNSETAGDAAALVTRRRTLFVVAFFPRSKR